MSDQNVGTGLAKMAETKRALATSTGIYREASDIARVFERAQEIGHFVSPATVAPTPPEGCAIVVSGVLVDIQSETYPIPGGSKRGLSKVILDKIAGSAGISWGGPREGRTDDGSDPHYCAYRAVATFRDLAGQIRVIEADKELDLRDGSAMAKAMKPGELQNQRAQILSMAQSKARNRAVRALGLRTSYEPAELAKPFLVARVQFTGQTEDPELRRRFAEMNAASMMMGTQALYGPAPASALRLESPPPVDAAKGDPEDLGHDPLPGSVPAEKVETGPVRPDSSSMPIYQGKGLPMKPIAETSDAALAKWAGYLADMDASGKVPAGLSKEVAGKQLGACLAEIDYRKAVAAAAAAPEGPGY